MAWFDTLAFCKKYLCSEKHKFRIEFVWLLWFPAKNCAYTFATQCTSAIECYRIIDNRISQKQLALRKMDSNYANWQQKSRFIDSWNLKLLTWIELNARKVVSTTKTHSMHPCCEQYFFFDVCRYVIRMIWEFHEIFPLLKAFIRNNKFTRKYIFTKIHQDHLSYLLLIKGLAYINLPLW